MNDDVDERLKLHYVYTGRDSQTYLDPYILGMQGSVSREFGD